MKNDFIENFNKQGRQLKDDEYIENYIIFCKKCKTARQLKLSDNITVNILCDCKSIENEKEQNDLEKARKLEQLQERRKTAISIPSYWNYTFENDDGKTPEVTNKCRKYVENFLQFKEKGQGLLLWGGVGTGKTYYAMCIANALIDIGVNVKHTSLATIIKQGQDFEKAERHYWNLMQKRLIIIDDLGTERTTAFAQEQIYKHIDGWNTLNIPLIITTNYTLKEIETASADTQDLSYARIYSRILEKCYPILVNSVKRRDLNKGMNRNDIEKLLNQKEKVNEKRNNETN